MRTVTDPPFRFRRPDRARILRGLVPFLAVVVICFCFWAEQVAAQENTVTTNITKDDDGDGNINIKNATAVPTNPPPSTSGGGTIVDKSTYTIAADTILFPWFVELLGCCTMYVLKRFNLPIPYAAVMFVLGAIMGYCATREAALENNDVRKYLQDSIIQWTNIDSATLLLVFLPGLIFKDAVEIPINLFSVAAGKLNAMLLSLIYKY